MSLLLFAIVPVAAVAEPMGSEVTREAYPDADAVLVREVERVKYRPDGTYESVSESWTKVLTEKGRREESTLTLGYSKRYGEGLIEYVGIIGADGTERQVDVSKTTKETTDNSSMSSNIYDPLDRTIACGIPGLAIGDVLHTKVVRRTLKPRCEGKWSDYVLFEWSLPILRSEYEVTAPPELPLKKLVIRHPLGNVSSSSRRLDDGSTVYTYVATNSPQAFPEPDMPALHTQVQHLLLSTAASWQEISSWYWRLSEPHLAKTNSTMAAKVASLAVGDREEKIRSIFRFVSQEVRYMGLTMEDTSPGYSPHDVDITFANRYGVCRDKAALLVAMLRLAGFEAYPVLIQVGPKLDREVPQPFFNHAIVAVAEGPGSRSYRLMDPTNENAKDLFPSYLCNMSYIVCRPDGDDLRTSDIPPVAENTLTIDSKGRLSKDGSLFLESGFTFAGINDIAYRHALVKMTGENRVKFFERMVKSLSPGGELVDCDILPAELQDTDKPLEVRLVMRLGETEIRGKTCDEMSMPFFSRTAGVVNFLLDGSTSLAERKYPLKLDTTAGVRERLVIELDEEPTSAPRLPPSENIDGGYRFSRSFSLTNRTLTASRSMALAAVEFSPDEYLDLRERIKDVEAADRRRPVFASDRISGADEHVLFDSDETQVFSDREWVTTNSSVREVLTYAGKKSSAELKFSYNPSWESISVVSAVVSNRDGKVSAVTPKEINEMDSSWAASAPRYPAGRILVVNLPGVEIGSVISVTTVRSVTNAPAPFRRSYFFDHDSPYDRQVARVNDWRREAELPRLLPSEPSRASAATWRDVVTVSSNDFARAACRLAPAVEVAPIDPPPEAGETLRSIRDWMAKHVRVAGPALYDLPIAAQLTPPETVLAERYASRLDYVRTLASLLKGAGYDVDIVFAASDGDAAEAVRRRLMVEFPDERAFASAVCRVRVNEGGFLGLGGEDKVFYVGTENQYAELGATPFDGCDAFDPESGEFFRIEALTSAHVDCADELRTYSLRADGSVDLDVESFVYGMTVAPFRKIYGEILPENRMRRFQELLGEISQAAMATSEFETDVESYPGVQRLSCFIPDYATVNGDLMTLQLPVPDRILPVLTGPSVRESPIGIGAVNRSGETMVVRFPPGFTRVERLPDPLKLDDPDTGEPWFSAEVTSGMVDGALEVRIERKVFAHPQRDFPARYAGLFRDWERRVNSRACRTVSVRREK